MLLKVEQIRIRLRTSACMCVAPVMREFGMHAARRNVCNAEHNVPSRHMCVYVPPPQGFSNLLEVRGLRWRGPPLKFQFPLEVAPKEEFPPEGLVRG